MRDMLDMLYFCFIRRRLSFHEKDDAAISSAINKVMDMNDIHQTRKVRRLGVCVGGGVVKM